MEGGRLPLRDSTPCRPKGSPLCTILRYQFLNFWLTDFKIFLRAPLAPIYTSFEGGGGRQKKRNFLVEIFQKVPKNAIFGLFFTILPAAQKFWPKQDLKKEVWKIFLQYPSKLVKSSKLQGSRCRIMSRLSRQNFGVSTFSTKFCAISTFSTPEKGVRLLGLRKQCSRSDMFRLSRPKIDILRLSRLVSTFFSKLFFLNPHRYNLSFP